ncbi:hypothetical protein AAKU52_000631 [Pedobacter sp. CG_S7]|uniref:hypothetical protein n=1 Tax=Pedobacter sp. CG_S7 TaxID=3143930 RepID=UPI00339A4CCA
MRKLLLAFTFSLLSTCAFSQMNGDFNYSIGVRGYNYMQMPKILNQTNSDKYITTYFNSYLVKFNDNQFSYRLNGSYVKKNLSFANNCENCELVDGVMKDFSFKVGFEKNFNYAVIQPYFAFDLGYRTNKFEGISTNINAQRIIMDMPQSQNSIIATKEGFTISPVFGVKFNPVKQISVFAESNLEFFYSYERQENVSQDVSNTRTLSKFHKTEYLINPVSIGIQVHFGNKN